MQHHQPLCYYWRFFLEIPYSAHACISLSPSLSLSEYVGELGHSYIDWAITTPLLILNLGLLAGEDMVLVAAVMGADIAMIFSGYMGSVALVPTVKWLWFVIGLVVYGVCVCACLPSCCDILCKPQKVHVFHHGESVRVYFFRFICRWWSAVLCVQAKECRKHGAARSELCTGGHSCCICKRAAISQRVAFSFFTC